MTKELEGLVRESFIKKLNRGEKVTVDDGRFVIAKVKKSADGRQSKYPIPQEAHEGRFEVSCLEKGRYRAKGEDRDIIFKLCFKGEGDWYVGEDLGGKKCLKINCPEEGERAEARIYLAE